MNNAMANALDEFYATGGCNDCHTNPPFAEGGDPFAGEQKRVNAARTRRIVVVYCLNLQVIRTPPCSLDEGVATTATTAWEVDLYSGGTVTPTMNSVAVHSCDRGR